MGIALTTAGVTVGYAVETTKGTRPTSGYIVIPDIKEVPELNPEPEALESTTLSETEFKTYVEGLKDLGGALSFLANYTAELTGLVEKLKGLAKAFAWGLVIILEVCAAALIITGTIWLLGTMLEQVGLAWQPVIDNGETITTAMLIGTALLVGIGLVVYGLGTISELERLTGKGNATSLADGMFINLREVGQKLVTGLVDGINNKYNTFKNTVDKLLNNTFSKSTAESYGNSFGKNLGSSMASAIKNTKFPTLKGTVNTSTSGTATINFKAYAEGGFPDMGQMFIARERGPELVGTIGNKNAVANNDQIVSGIEAGVYRAMRAANSGNNGGNTTIRIINEIDGDVVGEKVIKYHNGVVRRTGESPLLV